MDAQGDYVYEALEQPDKTIRLLEILSISPHICCKLIVVPLSDLPVFTTLSYVWGDSTARESIEVEGQTLKITSSLAGALRNVYGQFKSNPVDTGAVQWLWADGICINQADDHEKNYQVPLMRDVFSKCARMYSWLGIDKEDYTRAGIDAIDLIHTGISESMGYNLFMSGFDHNKYLSDSALMEYDSGLEYQTGHEFTNLAWLQKHYDGTLDFDYRRDNISHKICNLFLLPYWERLWILQECALAQDTVLLCGPKTASWVTICRVFAWLRLVKMRNSLSTRPYTIPQREWAFLILWGGISTPPVFIALLKSLQLAKAIGGQPVNGHYTQVLHRLESHSFTYRYRATDPKDYVYGVTGVSGYQAIPDYNPKTTTAKVYQKFAQFCLFVAKEAHETGSVRADYEFLWFICFAGIGFEWRITPDLPTWTPDFVGASNALTIHDIEPLMPFDQTLGYKTYDPWTQDIPYVEGSTLHCMTILMDTVSRIGPLLRTYKKTDDDYGPSEDFLLQLFDCVLDSRINNRYPAGYDLFRIMCGLMSDTGNVSPEQSARFLELVVANLEYLCETRRGLRRAEFATQLCEELSPNHTDDLLRRSNWSYSKARNAGIVESAWFGDWLMYQAVMSRVNQLCMAFTTSGYVGLLPPLAQVGDIVGIVKGYSLPVILRRSGNVYNLVGPCRMSGNLEDEAVEMLQDGRARMEKIEIY